LYQTLYETVYPPDELKTNQEIDQKTQPRYPNASQPTYSNAGQPSFSNVDQSGYLNAGQPGYSNASQPGYPTANSAGQDKAFVQGYVQEYLSTDETPVPSHSLNPMNAANAKKGLRNRKGFGAAVGSVICGVLGVLAVLISQSSMASLSVTNLDFFPGAFYVLFFLLPPLVFGIIAFVQGIRAAKGGVNAIGITGAAIGILALILCVSVGGPAFAAISSVGTGYTLYVSALY
jgi:hypothetical protein